MKHIVFVLGEPEYNSHETMPAIADALAREGGYQTTCCITSHVPDEPEFRESAFPNLEALDEADLMVIYTRFRVLPDRQMARIKAYLDSGRPVVGLRTATHSFHFPKDSKWASWNDGFGRDVLGTPWISHHGHSSTTDVLIMAGVENHPILQGIPASFHVRSWLYHVLPLPERCKPLLWGVPVAPECPPQENPVAWTSEHRGGRVFATTMGHPEDFKVDAFTTLLTNGIRWAVGDL